MASEKIINQKKEEVSKLAAKIKEAKIVLLTDYRGINVADVTGLRAELRKSNSEYRVIKNNITRRALAEAGIEGLEDLLEGPTAVGPSSKSSRPSIPFSAKALLVILFFITLYSELDFLNSALNSVTSATLIPL